MFLLTTLLVVFAEPRLVVQAGHGDRAASFAALSNDEKFLVSGGGRLIKLWETQTGREVDSINAHDANITSGAMDPKLARFATGDEAGVIKVWDLAALRPLQSFRHQGRVSRLLFMKSKPWLISVGDSVQLWHLETGAQVTTIVGIHPALSPDEKTMLVMRDGKTVALDSVSQKERFTLASAGRSTFSPDGKQIITASGTALQIWDARNGKLIRGINHDSSENPFVVVMSENKRFIARAGQFEHIRITDDKGALLTSISTEGQHRALAFTKDSRALLSVSDTAVTLYDTTSWRLLRRFTGYADRVLRVGFSQDNDRLLLKNSTTTAVWSLTGEGVTIIADAKGPAALSPDGKTLASSADGAVQLWDTTSGVARAERFDFKASNLAFSSDGTKLLAHCGRSSTALIDLRAQTPQGCESVGTRGLVALADKLATDANAKFAASFTGDSRNGTALRVFDLKSLRLLQTVANAGAAGAVTSVAVTGDGTRVAIATRDKIDTYDVPSGKLLSSLHGIEGIMSLAYSPDGKRLLVGLMDGTLESLSENSNKKYKQHTDRIEAVAFSPNGHQFVTASYDGFVIVWDATTNEALARLALFSDGSWAVATPNGGFDASDKGATHLHWVRDRQAFGLDQLYTRYYRPGLTAELFKLRAVARTQQQVSLTPTPEVSFTQPLVSESATDKQEIEVEIAARDMGGGVGEIRLFHNGKRVDDGGRGVKKRGKTLAFKLSLLEGVNTFRAVATNTEQVESTPVDLTVMLRAEKKTSTLHLVVIGINRYKNEQMNLGYAAPDARSIREFFSGSAGKLFGSVQLHELYDEAATRKAILDKLGQVQALAQPADVTVLYLGGHADTVDGKWFFMPHDLVYSEEPEHIRSHGISADELSDWLRKSAALKTLLLLDACKSGAATALLATRSGPEERSALKQLARSTGSYVLAASTKNQVAAELSALGHGIFTFALLDGLKGAADYDKDGIVTVEELSLHIKKVVPALSEKYRQQAQYPVSSASGMDFPLALQRAP